MISTARQSTHESRLLVLHIPLVAVPLLFEQFCVFPLPESERLALPALSPGSPIPKEIEARMESDYTPILVHLRREFLTSFNTILLVNRLILKPGFKTYLF